MIREILKITTKETTVKVAGNEVNAIRTKNLTKKGVRVYEDGLIGISGCIGNIPDEELVEQAKDNLVTKIEYPYEVTKNNQESREYSGTKYSPAELKTLTEDILDVLKKEYSEFLFSHMVKYTESAVSLKNDEGLDLEQTGNALSIGFVIKEKSSANLMDGFIGYQGNKFDLDKFWAFNRPYLNAYKTKAELPEGDKLPVVFMGTEMFMGFFSKELNGEKYGTGSSLYTGKMGDKLFNDKLTVIHNEDPEVTGGLFFDREGLTFEDDKVVLIEKGVLKNVLTDKKTAKDYNLPLTGGAKGEYDSRPRLFFVNTDFESDTKNLKEALNGQLAIAVVMSSGGDFTPDGAYASPVQVALLFDGENFIGKLDEFAISSHIDQMLGDDYIGTFDTPEIYMSDKSKVFACYMNIKRD